MAGRSTRRKPPDETTVRRDREQLIRDWVDENSFEASVSLRCGGCRREMSLSVELLGGDYDPNELADSIIETQWAAVDLGDDTEEVSISDLVLVCSICRKEPRYSDLLRAAPPGSIIKWKCGCVAIVVKARSFLRITDCLDHVNISARLSVSESDCEILYPDKAWNFLKQSRSAYTIG